MNQIPYNYMLDIISVGGANLEYIYKQNDESKFQIKQSYHQRETKYGGSGLNYVLRLTAMSVDVLPIIPIADDKAGNDIIKKINEEREKVNLLPYPKDFIINDTKNKLNTMESLIVSDTKGRTIWSPNDNNFTNEIFNDYIDDKLKDIDNPKFLLIGHIHSDNVEEKEQLSTYKLINKYSDKDTIIYLNLGKTQLKKGYDFWKDTLKKVDILQFNIEEIKYLFKEKDKNFSLNEIIKELKKLNNIVLITMDKLGAICIMNDNDDFYAYEIEIESEYKDKTGAGDAFASGIIRYLSKNNIRKGNITNGLIREAVKVGRLWATYACTKLGGASDCPNKKELEKTKEENKDKIKSLKDIDETIINLIDKAYSKCG